ncbi:MAG: hypothetical protein RL020_572 [Pseudomonadota bacterium]|jgi:uncharacterized protein
MQFRVELDAASEYRWRLLADNGKSVAISADGYSSKHECLDAIRLVQMSFNVPVIENYSVDLFGEVVIPTRGRARAVRRTQQQQQ